MVTVILRKDLKLRNSAGLAELYVPFQPLLFFGGGGGGDLSAFVRKSDGRWRVAFSLRDYLTRALRGAGSDWFREH
ncbi:hypothetical protein ACIG0D_16880 [Streptomyces sp. NPDC052773]|uniref:hypothetical protein n=1 Tax=Streptomyces sp. NPDC052773 TaxID=3365693 RepID=UPI0037D13A5F